MAGWSGRMATRGCLPSREHMGHRSRDEAERGTSSDALALSPLSKCKERGACTELVPCSRVSRSKGTSGADSQTDGRCYADPSPE